MMSDDKKKSASLIIGKMGKMSEAPKNEMGAEEDSSYGHMAAAEEIMSAIESKDASALKEALKSFYDMCASDESPEHEASEDESEG